MEIPHASKEIGDSIHGATKVFADDQAEPGETSLGMVHECSVSSTVAGVEPEGGASR